MDYYFAFNTLLRGTTTSQPRGGTVLSEVGQGQGVWLLQTTTFPAVHRQVK